MDLFDKITNLGPIGKYADMTEGYILFPKLEGELGPRMKFNGKEVIVWSVNNYLGLANLPEVRKCDADSAAKWGLAYPMGSRMMTGETSQHQKLEEELAEFVQKEKVFLLNFGYQGIMSAIDSLLGRHDVAVYDSNCHACIVDGLRMHIGKRFLYEHNDITSLEERLQKAKRITDQTGGGVLVITEGVFGMRGHQGKLREICSLKEKYGFRLMVDDAHGFGTLGETGYGAGEEQGVQDDIDVYFATFAKSMGSIGAFLGADADVIKFLKYNMRSQIFAKSLPMPIVEGNIKRLEILRSSSVQKDKLWNIASSLQKGLKERGFNIGDCDAAVTPVYLEGTTEEAVKLVYDLRENYGIFCSVVGYPVIPKGLILIRLIPTAAHTMADVVETLDAFDAIREKLISGAYAEEIA